MSKGLIKPLVYVLAFGVTLFIYWPALQGGPIWDDHSYWFKHAIVKPEFAWTSIWLDFNWPISTSMQRVLYLMFGKKYFYYHLFNLCLHFFNTLLLRRVLKRLEVPLFEWVVIAFLVHPANVLSVAWMIQLKTLLSFFFGILSFDVFLSALKQKRLFALSWLFFLFSMLSKSASVAMPVVIVGLCLSKLRTKQLLYVLPFFLISVLGTWRIYQSPVTTKALDLLENSALAVVPDNLLTSKSDLDDAADEAIVDSAAPIPEIPGSAFGVPEAPDPDEKRLERRGLYFTTPYYYFWQVALPINLIPVKAYPQLRDLTNELIHLVFLIAVIFICWNHPALGALAGGYVMLLPFLGIVSAPYMNITSVSDQHLYLAIPFFLAFWAHLLKKFQFWHVWLIPFVMCLVLANKTRVVTPWYRNEIIFYDTIFQYDPFNVPMAYNLAMAHLLKGEIDRAMEITHQVAVDAKEEKSIRSNRYYPYLLQFHLRMMEMRNKE